MESRIVKIQEAAKRRENLIQSFDAMHEEVRQQVAEKRRVEQVELFIKQVPHRYRGKTFTDYVIQNDDQLRIKNIALRFVETITERLKDGSCLVMSGRPGTGKTLLSLIMYQAIAMKNISVCYESSLEWVSNLIQQKYHSPSSYSSAAKIYETFPFIVFDEVTESLSKDGSPTEVERQMLFQIINKRYENNLCTVVITNRDEQTLIRRLGQPTIDRLQENGISLAFGWDSFRQK